MAHPRNRAERKRQETLKANRRGLILATRFGLDISEPFWRSKLLGYTQLMTRDADYGKPLDKGPKLDDQDY